ncbi:MAG: OprO/OprP family phosphate-selective porin, partial [Muribaculaceae bacterium]|nr:OprO/OprP family phosphate-selective porin [Muribaculaceae bacterium]
MSLRSIAVTGILALICGTQPMEASEPPSFIPTLHGIVRADYELSTDNGDSRFQVQNARLSASGAVLPFLDYFMQVDFCAAGRVRILDVYAAVRPTGNLKIFAGQMRVPFSAESTRSPRDYYFVNTALVQSYGNLRAVGVKAGYLLPRTPLYFEGGVFNASDMEAHTSWNAGMTYGVKANATLGAWRPEVAFMSRIPGGHGHGVRVNMANASLSWKSDAWFVEAEYIYRHYTGHTHDATHVYS